jgi:hypothetical protein
MNNMIITPRKKKERKKEEEEKNDSYPIKKEPRINPHIPIG